MSQIAHTLDFIALGRSCVDLYGQQVGGRLEDMSSFAKYVGGSPTNTAIGGARLGLRTGLISRVGVDHMGRFIREKLAHEGVDHTGVIDDHQRLSALAILGIRDRERFPLLFYRENCADMALTRDDLDEAWIKSARALVINGTHLSQPGVFDASKVAADWIKASGGRVVFDIDYRPVLWGLTAPEMGENRFVASHEVTARLQTILPSCDLVVGTEEEIRILGGAPTVLDSLRAIRERTSAVVVCKRGALGCVAFDGPIPDAMDGGIHAEGLNIEVFNVLGAGDAFMAGFLRGWLRGETLETSCQWANACGAIVVSRHSCSAAMPYWSELREVLDSVEIPYRLREDTALSQVHWAKGRRRAYSDLKVLAIDHRVQLADLALEVGVNPSCLARFKELTLRAVDNVAKGSDNFGILLDGDYGFDALAASSESPYWVGRPVEVPKSRPLQFEGGGDIATHLLEWPANQVVKCLVLYHPDDEPALKEAQEAQLLRLFDACRKLGHELLLEIILPAGMPAEEDTVSRAMRQFYELGLRPDWWKLEPDPRSGYWQHAEAVIAQYDPGCQGILMLGLSALPDTLIQSFQIAASFPMVKGFAVGRTIFYDVARSWMLGEIDDDGAVASLAANFRVLVDAWDAARNADRQPA
jgi:5-dehydro-2-deoxygluconokinase